MKKAIATALCALAACALAASFARANSAANAASSQKGGTMSNSHALMNPASLNAQAPATYDAKFVTTAGDFTVHVTRAWAPMGADRFYNLVKNGYYNNNSLFRVVPGFVVQFGINGDPKIAQAWANANIKDDAVKHQNEPGTITFAMAGPNTRTTQVFINYGDNKSLDRQGFAPFGEVTHGMDVVKKFFSGYGDDPTGHQDQITMQGNAYLQQKYPKLDKIESATIVEQ